MTTHSLAAPRPWITHWLAACCVCVFLMVAVGGLTRLTESGLSIVEWKPVSGILPPFTEAAWLVEFEKYRQFPEYQHKNAGMSLDEFKGIFWLEFWHRILGRITGLVVLLPLVFITVRKLLPAREIGHLWGIAALIGLQGLIGWVMVKSGLVDQPAVSHYKLTLHLGMAFVIFTLLFSKWDAYLRLASKAPHPTPVPDALKTLARLFCVAVFVQVLLGGLVAGLDAGLVYNTFPLMGERFVPEDAFYLQPFWRNLLENHAMVQFQHRLMAYALVLLFGVLVWQTYRCAEAAGLRRLIWVMACVLALQVTLGILTVLYSVPVGLASKHQMVALVLYAFSLKLNFSCAYARKTANNPTHQQVTA